jgi:hypothetical protein
MRPVTPVLVFRPARRSAIPTASTGIRTPTDADGGTACVRTYVTAEPAIPGPPRTPATAAASVRTQPRSHATAPRTTPPSSPSSVGVTTREN